MSEEFPGRHGAEKGDLESAGWQRIGRELSLITAHRMAALELEVPDASSQEQQPFVIALPRGDLPN